MNTARKPPFGAQRHGQGATTGRGTDPSRQEDQTQKVEQDIQKLAQRIRRFKIEAQRFLVGDLPAPPDELGERIHSELRRLRSANIKGAAANFRLGGLEAQFNSQRELFGRRLRHREQGIGVQAKAGKPRLNPAEGVVVEGTADVASAKALYEGLHAASGKPKMDLDRFRDYLDRQTEAIRKKTGCREIQFRVAIENGKTKLKAKPIRQSGSS